jgi:hypothetical protein
MMPIRALRMRNSSTSGGAVWTPASLGSKLLAWWDPSDTSTMTASGGGTPVSGNLINGINDKSGNSQSLGQGTGSRKPTYNVDGSGNSYIGFSAASLQCLATGPTFPHTLPFDRVFAIQQVSWTAGACICGFSGTAIGALAQQPSTPSLRLTDASSPPANLDNSGLSIGSNGVVTERHIAGASQLAINNGSYVTANAGSTAPPNGTFILGAISSTGASASSMRFYGGVVCDGTLTTTEIANLRTYLGAKCGLTL